MINERITVLHWLDQPTYSPSWGSSFTWPCNAGHPLLVACCQSLLRFCTSLVAVLVARRCFPRAREASWKKASLGRKLVGGRQPTAETPSATQGAHWTHSTWIVFVCSQGPILQARHRPVQRSAAPVQQRRWLQQGVALLLIMDLSAAADSHDSQGGHGLDMVMEARITVNLS